MLPVFVQKRDGFRKQMPFAIVEESLRNQPLMVEKLDIFWVARDASEIRLDGRFHKQRIGPIPGEARVVIGHWQFGIYAIPERRNHLGVMLLSVKLEKGLGHGEIICSIRGVFQLPSI